MTPPRRDRAARTLLALGLALLAGALAPPAEAGSLRIAAQPITRFCGSDGRDLVGNLAFVGGFAYAGTGGGRVSGVSSIRFLDAGTQFLSVTDKGSWFAGRIRRDGQGRPVGIDGAVTAPILDADGRSPSGKASADAESLSLSGSRVLAGFERQARLLAYDRDDPLNAVPVALPLPIPRGELRANGGLETIATSPLPGFGSVAVAETSIDAAGNLIAARFGGKDRGANGLFGVERDESWDATDGVFAENGDLLLLERQYTGLFGRIGMRIRRLPAVSLAPGKVADGPVIAEADLSCEIDNMEGIDIFRGPNGETRLVLVSDDNGSFLQRSLYLEFRLLAGN